MPLLANSIGAALNEPGLYQTTLHGLQQDYGKPRELHANSTLRALEDKLPTFICDKWTVYSD